MPPKAPKDKVSAKRGTATNPAAKDSADKSKQPLTFSDRLKDLKNRVSDEPVAAEPLPILGAKPKQNEVKAEFRTLPIAFDDSDSLATGTTEAPRKGPISPLTEATAAPAPSVTVPPLSSRHNSSHLPEDDGSQPGGSTLRTRRSPTPERRSNASSCSQSRIGEFDDAGELLSVIAKPRGRGRTPPTIRDGPGKSLKSQVEAEAESFESFGQAEYQHRPQQGDQPPQGQQPPLMYQYHPFPPNVYGPIPNQLPGPSHLPVHPSAGMPYMMGAPITAPQAHMLQQQHPLMMAMMQNSYPTLAAQHALLAAQRPQATGMLPLLPSYLRPAQPLPMTVGLPADPRLSVAHVCREGRPRGERDANDYLVFRVQPDADGQTRSVVHKGTDVHKRRSHRSHSPRGTPRRRSGRRSRHRRRHRRRSEESYTDSESSEDPIAKAIDNLRSKLRDVYRDIQNQSDDHRRPQLRRKRKEHHDERHKGYRDDAIQSTLISTLISSHKDNEKFVTETESSVSALEQEVSEGEYGRKRDPYAEVERDKEKRSGRGRREREVRKSRESERESPAGRERQFSEQGLDETGNVSESETEEKRDETRSKKTTKTTTYHPPPPPAEQRYVLPIPIPGTMKIPVGGYQDTTTHIKIVEKIEEDSGGKGERDGASAAPNVAHATPSPLSSHRPLTPHSPHPPHSSQLFHRLIDDAKGERDQNEGKLSKFQVRVGGGSGECEEDALARNESETGVATSQVNERESPVGRDRLFGGRCPCETGNVSESETEEKRDETHTKKTTKTTTYHPPQLPAPPEHRYVSPISKSETDYPSHNEQRHSPIGISPHSRQIGVSPHSRHVINTSEDVPNRSLKAHTVPSTPSSSLSPRHGNQVPSSPPLFNRPHLTDSSQPPSPPHQPHQRSPSLSDHNRSRDPTPTSSKHSTSHHSYQHQHRRPYSTNIMMPHPSPQPHSITPPASAQSVTPPASPQFVTQPRPRSPATPSSWQKPIVKAQTTPAHHAHPPLYTPSPESHPTPQHISTSQSYAASPHHRPKPQHASSLYPHHTPQRPQPQHNDSTSQYTRLHHSLRTTQHEQPQSSHLTYQHTLPQYAHFAHQRPPPTPQYPHATPQYPHPTHQHAHPTHQHAHPTHQHAQLHSASHPTQLVCEQSHGKPRALTSPTPQPHSPYNFTHFTPSLQQPQRIVKVVPAQLPHLTHLTHSSHSLQQSQQPPLSPLHDNTKITHSTQLPSSSQPSRPVHSPQDPHRHSLRPGCSPTCILLGHCLSSSHRSTPQATSPTSITPPAYTGTPHRGAPPSPSRHVITQMATTSLSTLTQPHTTPTTSHTDSHRCVPTSSLNSNSCSPQKVSRQIAQPEIASSHATSIHPHTDRLFTPIPGHSTSHSTSIPPHSTCTTASSGKPLPASSGDQTQEHRASFATKQAQVKRVRSGSAHPTSISAGGRVVPVLSPSTHVPLSKLMTHMRNGKELPSGHFTNLIQATPTATHPSFPHFFTRAPQSPPSQQSPIKYFSSAVPGQKPPTQGSGSRPTSHSPQPAQKTQHLTGTTLQRPTSPPPQPLYMSSPLSRPTSPPPQPQSGPLAGTPTPQHQQYTVLSRPTSPSPHPPHLSHQQTSSRPTSSSPQPNQSGSASQIPPRTSLTSHHYISTQQTPSNAPLFQPRPSVRPPQRQLPQVTPQPTPQALDSSPNLPRVTQVAHPTSPSSPPCAYPYQVHSNVEWAGQRPHQPRQSPQATSQQKGTHLQQTQPPPPQSQQAQSQPPHSLQPAQPTTLHQAQPQRPHSQQPAQPATRPPQPYLPPPSSLPKAKPYTPPSTASKPTATLDESTQTKRATPVAEGTQTSASSTSLPVGQVPEPPQSSSEARRARRKISENQPRNKSKPGKSKSKSDDTYKQEYDDSAYKYTKTTTEETTTTRTFGPAVALPFIPHQYTTCEGVQGVPVVHSIPPMAVNGVYSVDPSHS